MIDNKPLEPDPVIEAYKKHVDRSLLRKNLQLTVEERIDKSDEAAAICRGTSQSR